jgi:MYXO-CTERM domain-containing protein
MKCAKMLPFARASVLAVSLTLLPIASTTFAQGRDATSVPDIKQVDTRGDRDYTGLWGLLGLLGLAGLIGRRRPEAVEVYDTPTPPRTETRARP